MITGKEELLQVMIEAYLMEKGTNWFYSEVSRKAVDAEAKRGFGVLAGWEREHMQYMQYLYQSIMEQREMITFEEFKKKAVADTVEGGIPLRDLEGKMEEYSFLDDLGAFTVALEIEAKAHNLYKKLSETAGDTNVQAFMKEMMKWEEKHIEYLKALRYRISETS
ncbi:MAG: ferritin family protein [Thermodesulfovibrionales bacterium]|nr:ferritin family protein [Thermodesulfovibrionales bacterium]